MANGYHLRELKIEVNRECPLNCLHCSSNGAPGASEKLDSSRASALIREFTYMGGEALTISGGEPLVYKDLPLILSVCRNLGIHPDFYTSGIYPNGSFLSPISEDKLELLGQTRAKVIFSLHGAYAKTHDKLTQVVGSFNITMKAIELTLAAGISAEIHIVPTAINFGEIADMVELVAPTGIKKISWLRFVPQGRGESNRGLLQLSKEQLRQLAHKKIELQKMFPTMRIRTGSPFNILCPQSPSPCIAGLHVLTIRPNGYAVPCDAFKQFVKPYRFNNAVYYSLSEVWRKSEFLAGVRRVQELGHDSQCVSCPAYPRCKSGCLAQKAIAAGALTNGRDPDCLLEHAEVDSGEIKEVAVC